MAPPAPADGRCLSVGNRRPADSNRRLGGRVSVVWPRMETSPVLNPSGNGYNLRSKGRSELSTISNRSTQPGAQRAHWTCCRRRTVRDALGEPFTLLVGL